jgi:hypothetical protein
MLKGKLAACCLVAFGLLVASGTAFAGIIDECESSAAVVLTTQPGPTAVAAVCPQGDATGFGAQGFRIDVVIRDEFMVGIPNILASDFWLNDCDPVNNLVLCGGGSSSAADAATNSLGETSYSLTSIAAGGCATGLIVIVQGAVLKDPNQACTVDLCLDVSVRSYDINSDLRLSPGDLSLFAQGYPPNPYEVCTDYSGNGTNNLSDLSLFALHFGPPGHECP